MSIESSPYKTWWKQLLDFLRKNPPWNWRSHLKNAGDSFPFGVFWSVVQERLLLVSGECNLSAFHVHFETEIQDERCLKRGPRAGSSKKLGMRTRGEIHIYQDLRNESRESQGINQIAKKNKKFGYCPTTSFFWQSNSLNWPWIFTDYRHIFTFGQTRTRKSQRVATEYDFVIVSQRSLYYRPKQ